MRLRRGMGMRWDKLKFFDSPFIMGMVWFYLNRDVCWSIGQTFCNKYEGVEGVFMLSSSLVEKL